MEPSFNVLPLNYHPQQKDFFFEQDNIRFLSRFDSGNMLSCERHRDSCCYFIQIASDCLGTQQEYTYRTWFFFSVKNYNPENKEIKVRIFNMQNQSKLFAEGYKFVYRITDLYFNIDEDYIENEEFMWRRFPNDIKYEKFLENLERDRNLLYDTTILYNRDLLAFSKEKRRLELITISSNDSNTPNTNFNINNHQSKLSGTSNSTNSLIVNNSKLTNDNINHNNNITKNPINNFTLISKEPIVESISPKIANLKSSKNSNFGQSNNNANSNNVYYSIQFNRKSMKIPDKPIIFITARVHPGETPSSYLMNGILRFLLDKKDPRAEILRKAFVFKIIPMINVDGVSRGFYRYDTNSLNMNRHYLSPWIKLQPEIFAIKKIFLHFAQKGKVKYYYDLHAHASSRGLFLFGNNLDFLQQIENNMLPKLIELNSEDLIFSNCNFSQKSMRSKERGDKYSKEGTGRVHFNKICDIIHTYTVEASYFRGMRKNCLKDIKPINFNLLMQDDNSKSENFNFYMNLLTECIESNEQKEENKKKSKKKSRKKDKGLNFTNRKNSDVIEENVINFGGEKDENLESEILIHILSKFFNIEIEKVFFGNQEILKKVLIKKYNTDNSDENKKKEESQLMVEIKKNEKSSIISLDKSKEIVIENNDSSMDSSFYSMKSEEKIITELNKTYIHFDEKNHDKTFEKSQIYSEFINFENEIVQSVDKNIKEEGSFGIMENTSKSNSKSNFNFLKNFNLNKIIFDEKNPQDKASSEKKDFTRIEKIKPKVGSKLLKKNIHINMKSKDKKLSNKYLLSNEIQRKEILKEIENFQNFDFEVYQKLIFYDERYFLEANSLISPFSTYFDQCLKEEDKFYTPIAYEKMGISLLIAILDYEKLNPFSRIGNSDYKSLEKLRISVARNIINIEERYRTSAYCNVYLKNLNLVKKFESLNEKIIDQLINQNQKISKRRNSMSIRKTHNSSSNNNIIINNFNNNYISLITNENISNENNLNLNVDNLKNIDSKEISYNFNIGSSLMNNININNYNFNVCNFANSNNNNLYFENRLNFKVQDDSIKKSLGNHIEENISDWLKVQKPSFYDNNELSLNNSPNKKIKNVNLNYNSIHYSKQKSIKINNLINLQTNLENRNNKGHIQDQFNKYINHTNEKNITLIKIVNRKGESDENKSIKKSKLEEYPIDKKKINKFSINTPNKLKESVGLMKNKSMKNIKQKTQSESHDNIYDSDYFNENEESSIKSKINLNHKVEVKRISIDNRKYCSQNIIIQKRADICDNYIYNTPLKNMKSEKKDQCEKNFVSGSHAAKIRMLKEFNVKGNNKKSKDYLSVKCVGLNANFGINNNNMYNFTNNKLSSCLNNNNELIKISANSMGIKNQGNKNNSIGIFPNIIKK